MVVPEVLEGRDVANQMATNQKKTVMAEGGLDVLWNLTVPKELNGNNCIKTWH